MNLTLSELFVGLLSGKNKNFYAQVLNALDKVETPGIGTMGVGIRDRRLVLMYDPEFLKKISYDLGVVVIEHEALHLVLDHIPRYLEILSKIVDPDVRKKLSITANVAMDCAVNDHLKSDTEWQKVSKEFPFVTPEGYGLQTGESYEMYHADLAEQCVVQKLVIKGKGGNKTFDDLKNDFKDKTGDSHELWSKKLGDGEGADGEGGGDIEFDITSFGKNGLTGEELQTIADQLREQAKSTLRRSVEQHKASRGTIPGNVEGWLNEYLKDPVVPWYQLLTSRVQVTKARKPQRGIQKPNRVLLGMSEEDPTILPAIGRTWDPKFRVFLMVDTSGSMSDSSLDIARSELQHLLNADEDMEVRWMEVDAQMQYDHLFKKGDELPKLIHGRGGTDFDPGFIHIAKHYMSDDTKAPDIIIYYTDGCAPTLRPENRIGGVPVIWLITEEAYSTADHIEKDGYGEVIKCSSFQTSEWHRDRKKK